MGNIQTQAPSNALAAWGQRNHGRSIFARGQHRQLLDNFQQISQQASHESYEAQALVKAVNRLRGEANPLDSMLCPGNPTRRMLVAGGFEIEYELNSYYGDSQTDVEIVDIRLVSGEAQSEQRPALWQAEYDEEWRPKDEPSPRLNPTTTQSGGAESPIKVGVNGQSKDLSSALSVVSDHISRGEDTKLNTLKTSGFQLLYVPSEGSARAAGWRIVKSLGTQGSDQQRLAARILAGHMHEAHQQGLHVEWTSQGEGAWVLIEAMQHLQRQKIDLQQRQKIFLSDHTRSQFVADRARRSLNMDTSDGSWSNSAPGLPQTVGGQNFGIAPLLSTGDKLIHHTPRGERLGYTVNLGWQTGEYLMKKWGWAGAVAGVVSATGGSAALAAAAVKALHKLAPAMISALPGARDNYFKGTGEQLQKMINSRNKR